MPEEQVVVPKTIPPVETKSDKRLLIFIVIGLAILILLAIIGIVVGVKLLITSQQRKPNIIQVTETPTPTPVDVQKSKFASDAAVLKLKNDINNLGNQIDSADYFETEMLPPSLDSQIKIE